MRRRRESYFASKFFLRCCMRSKWPMLQPMPHAVLFFRRSIAELIVRFGFRDVRGETTVLTMDYLADQRTATNLGLSVVFQAIGWIIPAQLRYRPFGLNIGEFLAYPLGPPARERRKPTGLRRPSIQRDDYE